MNTTARGLCCVALLALAGATACEHTPTAIVDAGPDVASGAAGGADHFEDTHFFDMTDSYYLFACDADGNPVDGTGGELVLMRGGIFSRFTAVLAPSGNVLVNYKTMPVGLGGVGVDSGEEFRVREAESGNSSTRMYGATNPYRYTLTMRGIETGRTMIMTFSGMFNVHDRGIRIDRYSETIECRV